MTRKTTRRTKLVAALLLATLVAASCTDDVSSLSGDPESPTTTSMAISAGNETSDGVDLEMLDETLVLLDEAYRRVEGGWQGFEPPAHPVVLAWKSGGQLVAAITINHPDPDAIGSAEQIEHEGSNLGQVHLVDDLKPSAAGQLQGLVNFEFDTKIGDVGSFLMEANPDDEFFNPTSNDYGSTLLHEMFHRYQQLNPQTFDPEGFQDVDGYPYTAENLATAVLEDRALLAALAADNDDDRTAAARHVAALRMARLQAEPRVILDQDQELSEGSARYVEHLLGGDDTGYTFHNANFDQDLFASPADAYGIKDTYGFGRFYATGAAIYQLLGLLGHQPDVLTEQSGEPPAALLAQVLGVTDADIDDLVTEATSIYDPENDVADLASQAEATATGEPSPFADDSGESGTGETDGAVPEGDYIEITDEEATCLSEELGAEGDNDGQAIPNEIWELCVSDS